MELTGRVALVTGGGIRVGRAIADALSRAGMRVAIHHHGSAQGASSLRAEIEARGGEARAFRADLTDPEAPARLTAEVSAVFGTLDVLINSAAVMVRTPLGEVTTEQWDSMFALNLRAPFFLAQAAAGIMKENPEGGAIVNIADLAAFETWPGYIPHGISKAGIVAMTRSLAKTLGPAIRVNAIAPGGVLMPEGMDEKEIAKFAAATPMQRLGDPADVTQAVLYLLRAEYVTGETIMVDGGRHVRA